MAKPATNPFQSQPRIFIVDDEPAIAQMLTVILQMNLFDATAFTDPHAALEAARANPPAYLISDIMMPGLNGIDLAITLQRELPSTKTLLFTGQVDSSNLLREAQAAGHHFTLIQKPIHPTKLVAALRSL